MGQGPTCNHKQQRDGQLISIMESAFPQFRHELPSPSKSTISCGTPIHSQWCHPLQGKHSHPSFTLTTHPNYTPLHSAFQGMTSVTVCTQHLYYGQASSQPSNPWRPNTTTVSTWHPRNPVLNPVCLFHQYTLSSACADFFHYKGTSYLVVVDHYSNWTIIEHAHKKCKDLIDCFHCTFNSHEFPAAATCKFLQEWGMHHHLSSLKLAYKLSNSSSLSTLIPMAVSTQSYYNAPSSSISTPLTPKPGYPLRSAYLTNPSRTSYPSCQATTSYIRLE